MYDAARAGTLLRFHLKGVMHGEEPDWGSYKTADLVSNQVRLSAWAHPHLF